MYLVIRNGRWRRSVLPCAIRELDALQHFRAVNNRHANVIRMLDYDLVRLDDSETVLWVILQNMDRDLSMHIKELTDNRQIMTLEEIKRTAFHVLKGIAHIHANGFIDRDISPKKVLLGTDDSTLKLADFSLTHPSSGQSRFATKEIGDLCYCAPEVLFQNGSYGHAGDMWSLGVLICEMALGRKLFEGSSKSEVLHSMFGILGSPDLSTVPQELMHIVLPFRVFIPSTSIEEIPMLERRIGDKGVQLLKKLLSLECQNRPTAQEALYNRFFDTVST